MNKEISEHIQRTVRVKIARDRNTYKMLATGYGEVISMDELLQGLDGRIITVTVETEG